MVFILSPKNIPWKVVTALLVTIAASIALLNLAKQKRGGDERRSPAPQKQLFQSRQTPSASESAQPTDALPIGWQKIAGNSVELWLPASYVGGNPSQDLEEKLTQLKAVNRDYEKVIEGLRLNPDLALAAFKLPNSKSGFLTNVNILREKVPTGTKIEQYLQMATQEISGQYRVVDQKVVFLNQYQAARLIAEVTTGNAKVKQLFYAIPQGNTFWLVTYSTSAEEFEQLLPTFEKSIRTLTNKS